MNQTINVYEFPVNPDALPEYRIAVMQKALETGVEVECCHNSLINGNKWTQINNPLWNWDHFAYRIKKESFYVGPSKDAVSRSPLKNGFFNDGNNGPYLILIENNKVCFEHVNGEKIFPRYFSKNDTLNGIKDKKFEKVDGIEMFKKIRDEKVEQILNASKELGLNCVIMKNFINSQLKP